MSEWRSINTCSSQGKEPELHFCGLHYVGERFVILPSYLDHEKIEGKKKRASSVDLEVE